MLKTAVSILLVTNEKEVGITNRYKLLVYPSTILRQAQDDIAQDDKDDKTLQIILRIFNVNRVFFLRMG